MLSGYVLLRWREIAAVQRTQYVCAHRHEDSVIHVGWWSGVAEGAWPDFVLRVPPDDVEDVVLEESVEALLSA
jgi:hypothetical protein